MNNKVTRPPNADAILSQWQLPQDPRVLHTGLWEVFAQVAGSEKFSAALRLIGHHGVEELSEYFHTLSWNLSPRELNLRLHGDFDFQKGRIKFLDALPFLSHVESELRDMVTAYCLMTGHESVQVNILDDMNFTDAHKHPYPVLNCTWLQPGTQWENPEGGILQAQEGEWFFFNPGFVHFSPPKTERRRITVIVMPDPAQG
jgi:hypothetical protein